MPEDPAPFLGGAPAATLELLGGTTLSSVCDLAARIRYGVFALAVRALGLLVDSGEWLLSRPQGI